MSLILETPLPWFQRLFINIIKTGQVPKHVAFIMDGNRRYAKKAHQENQHDRTEGFLKLAETLQWCKELGVTEVTAYTFSINNFQRSKEEVDVFMALARKTLESLLKEKEKIMKIGLCVRVIGNISYITPELQKLIAKVMLLTENNTNFFFNVAFAYSSRDEITNSIKCIVEGVNSGLLDLDDINEQLISNCFYTNKSPDPDLLIRTSGVTHFSDFLLWQISCTQVCFTDAFWPELSIWHFLSAILKYQTNYKYMLSVKKTKDETFSTHNSTQNNVRVDKFLERVEQYRRNQLENKVNE